MSDDRDYVLWSHPRGGEYENEREKHGAFDSLDEAIAASDYPDRRCWDQSTSTTWQLDDPIIEAAGREYSWLAIDRTSAENKVSDPAGR